MILHFGVMILAHDQMDAQIAGHILKHEHYIYNIYIYISLSLFKPCSLVNQNEIDRSFAQHSQWRLVWANLKWTVGSLQTCFPLIFFPNIPRSTIMGRWHLVPFSSSLRTSSRRLSWAIFCLKNNMSSFKTCLMLYGAGIITNIEPPKPTSHVWACGVSGVLHLMLERIILLLRSCFTCKTLWQALA